MLRCYVPLLPSPSLECPHLSLLPVSALSLFLTAVLSNLASFLFTRTAPIPSASVFYFILASFSSFNCFISFSCLARIYSARAFRSAACCNNSYSLTSSCTSSGTSFTGIICYLDLVIFGVNVRFLSCMFPPPNFLCLSLL